MKNSKVIVLNGFSRGGTNIVWNLLQSHPNVCSALAETGEIFYDQLFQKWGRLARRILTDPILLRTPMGYYFQHQLDAKLFDCKMSNLEHPDDFAKFEGVPYTSEEVAHSVLCLKSVDLEINLTEYFMRSYKNSFFIGLIRNGYAVCNGWMRRGRSADEAGRVYRRIGLEMIDFQAKYQNYKIVQFEDVLKDPFGMASLLYTFCELEPIQLEKLKLKTKKVLSSAGVHQTKFGQENRKYWLDRNEIADFIDPSIDDLQVKQLSDADRAAFERHAKPVLQHFNYLAS